MVVIENFGTCNLRCAYCFPEHMWQREGHHGVISDETFRAACEKVLSSTTADTVDVHLAGGEPLLAGRAWLESAFDTARTIAAGHGKTVSFSLQTNATTVTPELAAWLVEQNVTVGVSLDGDRVINEKMRGQTDRTLAGFGHLRDARGGRPPGVIVTVTRCNAERMADVVGYLDTLGVAMFRANQMGATASWNEHAAPRAAEWTHARTTIFTEIAGRRGRMMEFNLSQAVQKFVRSLLGDTSPFDQGPGCCAMRCPAGRELLYFDRAGHAYPCPRSNVTEISRIGHVDDLDFDTAWAGSAAALDEAMRVPDECRACPAQLACDYGCHAFNTARGNFFEVNCDASKDYHVFLTEHLRETALLYLLVSWRRDRRELDDYAAVVAGTEPPAELVEQLAGRLRAALDARAADPAIDQTALERRYGWRSAEVPVLTLDRPRVGTSARTRRGSRGR